MILLLEICDRTTCIYLDSIFSISFSQQISPLQQNGKVNNKFVEFSTLNKLTTISALTINCHKKN